MDAFQYNDLQQQRQNDWNQWAADQWTARVNRLKYGDPSGGVYTGDRQDDSILRTVPGAMDAAKQFSQMANRALTPKVSMVSYENNGQPYYQVGGEDVTDKANAMQAAMGIPAMAAAQLMQQQRQVQAQQSVADKSRWDIYNSLPGFSQYSAPQRQALYHLAEGETLDDVQNDEWKRSGQYNRYLQGKLLEGKLDKEENGGGMTESDYTRRDSLMARAARANAEVGGIQDEIAALSERLTPKVMTPEVKAQHWWQSDQPAVMSIPDPEDQIRLERKKNLLRRNQAVAEQLTRSLGDFRQRHKLDENGQPERITQVKTAEDYNALPSGAVYLTPDGKRKRKQ